VERRQTLPILANILLKFNNNTLTLIATDLEVELQAHVGINNGDGFGETTVSARKLMDICRALPDKAVLEFLLEETRLIVRSSRSKFTLAILPANQFPSTESAESQSEFTIEALLLQRIIDETQFAMAQQDVRYYLNGMFLEFTPQYLRAVTTDGHRLALSQVESVFQKETQMIVPRKAIIELSRLLSETSGNVAVLLGTQQLRVKTADYQFTSKLIDARYPDYQKVIPENVKNSFIVDRDLLRNAVARVSVLAHEKHRSIRMEISSDMLRVLTNNPEQEEAEEEVNIEYQGTACEIAFNVSYLLDAINALPAAHVKFTFSDPDSTVRVESVDASNRIYVIMPMRL
jgi:DNA polymerase-3 subunit beta